MSEQKDGEINCNKCCFKCANLTELGDGTYICALRSSKSALFVIENPYSEVNCEYYEELPDEVLEQLVGDTGSEEEELKLDIDESELDNIEDMEDLFSDD